MAIGTPPEQLHALLRPGATLAWTEGAAGGRLLTPDATGDLVTSRYPAIPSGNVVDTTGAGDVFLAAMLAARLQPSLGDPVTVAIFAPGDRVKITGVTKGRGFQGVVHRHHFGGGPQTHGNTRHRKPGSIAPGTDPSRIIKGKRMPGHMGARNFTELGVRVVKVDAERNLLFVRGSVPGPTNGLLTVRKQGGKSRHD